MSLFHRLAMWIVEPQDPSRFCLVTLFMSFLPSPFFGRMGMERRDIWDELSTNNKSFIIFIRTISSIGIGLILTTFTLWFGFAPVGFSITMFLTVGFGFWITFWAKHTEMIKSVKSLFSLLNINKRLERLKQKREEEIRKAEAQLEAMRRADPILQAAEREVAEICSSLADTIEPKSQIFESKDGSGFYDFDGAFIPNSRVTAGGVDKNGGVFFIQDEHSQTSKKYIKSKND